MSTELGPQMFQFELDSTVSLLAKNQRRWIVAALGSALLAGCFHGRLRPSAGENGEIAEAEGWAPLDQTKVEALGLRLEFVCSKLEVAKFELKKQGYLNQFRIPYQSEEIRSKFEGELRPLKQALTLIEAKERKLSADHPGQLYIKRAKEAIYKLRGLINETTGLWEMKG